jgi:hypothetical protein
MALEIQGTHHCARGGRGVMVTQPLPGQSEQDFIDQVHRIAESVQYACNQGSYRTCPPDCQVAKLIEITKNHTTAHKHPQD